jgi:plasmid stabilization system protein ParE
MEEAEHRIVWSSVAVDDLFSIWDYLAREASPEVADRKTEEVYKACEKLSQLPLLGRRA